jgi:hypothetical protein
MEEPSLIRGKDLMPFMVSYIGDIFINRVTKCRLLLMIDGEGGNVHRGLLLEIIKNVAHPLLIESL